jgi:hypothetical protein
LDEYSRQIQGKSKPSAKSFGVLGGILGAGVAMEISMLKHLSICAAVMALTAGAANAQQKEAMLQRMEVPGAAFDVIVASPKPDGVTFDLSESPDALVVYLTGGELALGFSDADIMLKVLGTLRRPVGAVRLQSPDHRSSVPIAVYLVPAGE